MPRGTCNDEVDAGATCGSLDHVIQASHPPADNSTKYIMNCLLQ